MRQQRGVRRPAVFPEGRQPKREQKHLATQQTKVGSQPRPGERGEGAGEARASRVVVGGVRGSVRAATSKGVHKHWELGLGVVAVASLVVGHSSIAAADDRPLNPNSAINVKEFKALLYKREQHNTTSDWWGTFKFSLFEYDPQQTRKSPCSAATGC